MTRLFSSHRRPDPKLNISRWLVICIINYKRFALARTKPFYVLLDSQRKEKRKKYDSRTSSEIAAAQQKNMRVKKKETENCAILRLFYFHNSFKFFLLCNNWKTLLFNNNSSNSSRGFCVFQFPNSATVKVRDDGGEKVIFFGTDSRFEQSMERLNVILH